MTDPRVTDPARPAVPPAGSVPAASVWTARAALARHLPERADDPITLLGEGMDNVAYLASGGRAGDELVVRVRKAGDPAERADATRREAGLLAAVAGVSPVPVPSPVLADPELGVIAYPRLPGRPLMDGPVPDPGRLAEPLGRLLARLHAVPVDQVRGLVEDGAYPLASWRDDAERNHERVGPTLPGPARRLVERFLAEPPPPEPTAVALCHYDLGAEHLLVGEATGEITGVIDWADAALVDPMVDLALILRDLGPSVADRTHAAYAAARAEATGTALAAWPDADRARAVFYARCALLADLAYAADGRNPRYRAAGLAHLPRTFA